MARSRAIAMLLIRIAYIHCVVSFDEGAPKHIEKRSPKPQFSQFLFGQTSKSFHAAIVPNVKYDMSVIPFSGSFAKAAILTQTGQQNQEPGCQVHIKSLQEKQPVFLSIGNPDSLMMPVDGNLIWAAEQRNWIACPPPDGYHNSIKGKNLVSAEIECVEGLMFRYVHDHTLLSITQVSCDKRVTGNERTSTLPMQQCPGSYKAVGFNISFPYIGYRFFDLYYICFNDIAATTIYTNHTLFGNEIQHKCITTSSRPSFKAAGFPDNMEVLTAYTQNNQTNQLTELFAFAGEPRPRESADMYLVSNYLQRGHLNPDADGLFTTWQWSSYFYINVVGMWNTINNGNWKYLEESVRSLAVVSKKNYEIYTGAYDVLSLCSLEDHCVDFTLSGARIPVPKWLWKIVKSPDLDAAIALVVSNNPFDTEAPICGLGGESYGWNRRINLDRALGEVSYCSVQGLQSVVGHIPQGAFARFILPRYFN